MVSELATRWSDTSTYRVLEVLYVAMVNKVNFAYYLQFLLSLLHGQSDQINLDFSNLNPKIVTTNTQLKAHMGGITN